MVSIPMNLIQSVIQRLELTRVAQFISLIDQAFKATSQYLKR